MPHTLTIVSLGPSRLDLLPPAALSALENARLLFLRTERHAVADALREKGVTFGTFDALSDSAPDFDAYNAGVSDALLAALEKHDVVYAVLDASQDETVKRLYAMKPEGVRVTRIAGVSMTEACLAALPDGCQAESLRVAPAARVARMEHMPEEALLVLEVYSRVQAGEVKLRLLDIYPPEHVVTALRADRNGRYRARAVPLCEADRQPEFDHTSALYVPPLPYDKRERHTVHDLMQVMRRLRAPDGCPWDREQTHESLAPNLLEEACEAAGAIREGDIAHMYDELGDVLLQIAFHSVIGEQCGEFDLTDVASAICEKMISRHTHIFGTEKADTAADVLVNWEANKRKERGLRTHADAMRDVSRGLTALMRAEKVQHKAAKVRFDFQDARDALSKVTEETREVLEELDAGRDPSEELGDLLFSVVNVARLSGKNAEILLTDAIDKFIRRFSAMENAILSEGKGFEGLTTAEMDVYWMSGKH